MTRLRRVLLWLTVTRGLAVSLPAQVTETPVTIAPGKVLVRMDGIKLSTNRADGAGNTYSALGVASTVVSTGLTQDLDLQVGFDLFYRQTVKYQGASNSDSGFGDVSFRTKWTFWKDDQFGEAAAILPYLKVPTNRIGPGNREVEGGLIVPWEMKVVGGFTAGAMGRWDVLRNDTNTGYDSHWGASGFARQELALGFTAYAEATFDVSSAGFSDWAGQVGGGVLWKWSDHIVLDYELLRGLNARASQWTHVLRLNWSL